MIFKTYGIGSNKQMCNDQFPQSLHLSHTLWHTIFNSTVICSKAWRLPWQFSYVFSSAHLKSPHGWVQIWCQHVKCFSVTYPPFVTNISFLGEKENECWCNAETRWEKWMFSFWKVDIFFLGGGAKNTHNSVPSRYATLITHLTLLPGVSSSLSEWLTCLSVLGWKQETCPPFWGGTTDWHLECSFPPY